MTSLDRITLALISTLLLKGKVLDAEAQIDLMENPDLGTQLVKDWKQKYAGVPHAQWAG